LRVPPVEAIHRRVRRGARIRVTAAVVVVLAIVGGVGAVRLDSGLSWTPSTNDTATAQGSPLQGLIWLYTLVDRDDRHLRVYVSPDRCGQALDTAASVVGQDSGQIRVQVSGQAVYDPTCAFGTTPVSVVVTVDRPVAGRQIVDAAGRRQLTLFQRELPQPFQNTVWHPLPSTPSAAPVWTDVYVASNGDVLTITAQAADQLVHASADGTVTVLSRELSLEGYDGNKRWVAAWWVSGGGYSVTYESTQPVSKAEFEALLNSLLWG
jgi:hypothetical protein